MGEAFFVEVITTHRDNPDVITDRRTVNWANSKRRERLERYTNWALRNGFAVHVAAKDV